MDMSIAVFLTINGKIPSSNYKSLPALNDHSLHICSFFHTHGLLKNIEYEMRNLHASKLSCQTMAGMECTTTGIPVMLC